MSTLALFKSNYTSTCIQHPTKVPEFGHTPSWCICQNSSSDFRTCPHFTCPNMIAFNIWMASYWTLSEHPTCSRIWHTCWPGYTLQQHHPHNHYELSIHEPPYALQVLVNWQMLWALEQKWSCQDFMLLSCVSWKSSIAFSCWPALTSSVIKLSNAPHWNSKIPKVKICTFLCQSMYCYELNISSWSSSILTSYTW